MGNLRKLLAWVLVFSMILSAVPMRSVSAEEAGSAVLSALDFGADPTGAADSTVAIQKALAAAKELEEQGKAVTLVFPQGEYHIYKDKAETREYHTSNTNSSAESGAISVTYFRSVRSDNAACKPHSSMTSLRAVFTSVAPLGIDIRSLYPIEPLV